MLKPFSRTTTGPTENVTYTLSSIDSPHPEGFVENTTRVKIIHYRRLCTDRPDPIVCRPLVVNTSGHLYDDFLRLIFLHTHREDSPLVRNSDQIRCLGVT